MPRPILLNIKLLFQISGCTPERVHIQHPRLNLNAASTNAPKCIHVFGPKNQFNSTEQTIEFS